MFFVTGLYLCKVLDLQVGELREGSEVPLCDPVPVADSLAEAQLVEITEHELFLAQPWPLLSEYQLLGHHLVLQQLALRQAFLAEVNAPLGRVASVE